LKKRIVDQLAHKVTSHQILTGQDPEELVLTREERQQLWEETGNELEFMGIPVKVKNGK
jgi:hypothetical protein